MNNKIVSFIDGSTSTKKPVTHVLGIIEHLPVSSFKALINYFRTMQDFLPKEPFPTEYA